MCQNDFHVAFHGAYMGLLGFTYFIMETTIGLPPTLVNLSFDLTKDDLELISIFLSYDMYDVCKTSKIHEKGESNLKNINYRPYLVVLKVLPFIETFCTYNMG